jgi:hypothetical protein
MILDIGHHDPLHLVESLEGIFRREPLILVEPDDLQDLDGDIHREVVEGGIAGRHLLGPGFHLHVRITQGGEPVIPALLVIEYIEQLERFVLFDRFFLLFWHLLYQMDS